MTQTPVVSVLMTAYNRERYIRAAIESVLGQTFEDLELVIVDDCSSDGTVGIARRYESDPRVHIVQNTLNLGDYPNRNSALTLARGEYVKYHDSDDLMYPHCLATMYGFLERAPTAAFALSGPSAWSGGPCPMLLTPRMCYQREFLGTGMFNQGPASALFRTGVLRSLGGWPIAGAASDYLFWLSACRKVNVLLVPADLHWYRLHPGQEIRSKAATQSYASSFGVAWRALESSDCPLAEEEIETAKANFIFSIVRQAYWETRSRNWRRASSLLLRSGIPAREWRRAAVRRPRDPMAGTLRDSSSSSLEPYWDGRSSFFHPGDKRDSHAK